MSRYISDDEDLDFLSEAQGSGDGVEIEIEKEFNKFIELSWVRSKFLIWNPVRSHLRVSESKY